MDTNRINGEAPLRAFYPLDPRKPIPSELKFVIGKETLFGKKCETLAEIQSSLSSITEIVFHAVTKELETNASGIARAKTVTLSNPLYQTNIKNVSALFNKAIGKHFGISLQGRTLSIHPENDQHVFFISWDPYKEQELRNILGVNQGPSQKQYLETMNAKRKEEKETDVFFEIEGSFFQAHKIILAQYPSLAPLLESTKGTKENPLVLKNFQAKIFHIFLDYLYTGKVILKELTLDDITELTLLAEKFNILNLKKQCLLHLMLFHSPEAASFAEFIGDTRLLQACRPANPSLKISAETFVKIFFNKEMQTLFLQQRNEIIKTLPPDAYRGWHTFLSEKEFFISLTKTIFDRIQKELAANGEGALIGLIGAYDVPREEEDQITALITHMFKTLFTETLGITIDQKPYGGQQGTQCLLASWSREQDQDLRCFFNVPYRYKLTDTRQHLNIMRKIKESTDVSFEVDGKNFAAHKSILSQNSYFSAMFERGFKESSSDAIRIIDVHPDIFEALLEYLYTGRLFLTDRPIEFLMGLANYADMVDVPMITKLCRFRLLWQLSKENSAAITDYAKQTNDTVLLDACSLFASAQKDTKEPSDIYPLSTSDLYEYFSIRRLAVANMLGVDDEDD